ncbi:ArsR/SmtB family transcription factor [Microterricola viridarii]|uniref:Helix-turn-helix domain-containing protein n=1 Tax=Microterricola viridarii TaxID=412690 RepID=A0A1H1LK07_9MICO|nr:metalloregulator ArsR/SmtB family transcription factor [Microterricola viridarii]SDR74884.1 Helix-turn-helix domain-containing protein [Microterricola viridarii]
MSAAPSGARPAPLTAVFAALGDDTRWQILVRLGAEPASASALSTEFPISRQALAKQLEVLRGAGLVEAERHGRELRYRAVGAALGEAARRLERVASGWDERLASIKAAAEAAAPAEAGAERRGE